MDNVYSWLRVACGASAILGGAFLLYMLASGRSSFAAKRVRRAEDPKGYWIGVASFACFVTGMALAATVARDKQIGSVVGLTVFVPALLVALTTGRFEWEADDRRIDSPGRFWRWVALYVFLSLIWVVILIWP